MPKIAIAILNWNGKNWLEKFLPTVIRYSENAEVYIIDNASTDGSVAFLNEYFPEVKIIQNTINYGFTEGYTIGLKMVNAEIYCLLNSDVEVTPNWLTPVLEMFDANLEIAAVQPKILDYNKKDFFEFAGAGGGFIDNLGYPYCRGRIFDSVEKDEGQYDDETEIFWASGCALFIRKKDFYEQNGFDSRFFAHQEEIDLCWRLKNSGKRIMYTGKSTVYHVGGGTLSKQNPQKTYLNFRNNLSMLLKNLPFPQVVFLIISRLFLDGIAGIYLGYKNGLPHIWAVVCAHFAFYAQAPKTIKLRQKNQIKNYYNSKWLIFKHYLK